MKGSKNKEQFNKGATHVEMSANKGLWLNIQAFSLT